MKLQTISQLIHWDIITHRKQYQNHLLTIFGTIVLMSLLMNSISRSVEEGAILTYSAFIVYCILQITDLSSIYHTKAQRINVLMLPATLNEKLAARLIHCAILVPLSTLLILLPADLAQFAVTYGLGLKAEPGFLTGYFLEYTAKAFTSFIITFDDMQMESAWLSLLSFASGFSFLLMCGCVWTKHAWAKGLLVSLVGLLLFALIGAGSLPLFNLNALGQWADEHNELAVLAFATIYSLFNLAFTAFCLWYGYTRFTRRQVMENKWSKYGF